jgi:Fe-S-cluster-containing dehydrogenase component
VAGSFVFDTNRCTGCAACRLACTIENDLPPGRSWRRIETFNERHRPELPLYHLSLACNHCDQAACMDACPALAYSRDAGTGAVILDGDKCVGCRYCAWACPYDAPVFDESRGVMSKCTWCNGRLKDGLPPACAALCPTGALGFEDLDPSDMTQSVEGFPRTALGPHLRIEPLRAERVIPVLGEADRAAGPASAPPRAESGISLRTEWSLMAFTLMASCLVAAFGAAAGGSWRIAPWAFAAGSAVTMALASAHLGRKSRAWRAVLNVRRSWLSREVVTLSAFFASASLWSLLAPEFEGIGLAITALGFVGLFCADRVYGVLRRAGSGYHHSASVLGTGLFLLGIFSGLFWLAFAIGLVKVILYIRRKLQFLNSDQAMRPLLTLLRISLGFLAPLAWWASGADDAGVAWIACVLVGEAIDRAEYYLELERETPRRQMADVLMARWREQS